MLGIYLAAIESEEDRATFAKIYTMYGEKMFKYALDLLKRGRGRCASRIFLPDYKGFARTGRSGNKGGQELSFYNGTQRLQRHAEKGQR